VLHGIRPHPAGIRKYKCHPRAVLTIAVRGKAPYWATRARRSFLTVDINDDDPGDGAGRNSDVGIWPFAPPRFDLTGIGGCDLEAAFYAGMFAGVFAAIFAASALAVLNGVEGKDAQSAIGVRLRPLDVGC
jgi:hypothetical protein